MTARRDGFFRLLIVEDDPRMLARLRLAASSCGAFDKIDTAGSSNQAKDLLTNNRYHFVSIDQNLPDETDGIVGPKNGLDLCERIVSSFPLTNRSFYTGHGKSLFAQRAGSLDGTRYIEKRVADSPSEDVDEMDPEPYIDWIAGELQEHYAPWCLDRLGRGLPRGVGGIAEETAKAWRAADWLLAGRSLSQLWALSLELAWCQTAALARLQNITLMRGRGTGGGGFNPAGKEEDIAALWPILEQVELMGPWQKFLPGSGAVTAAARNMRQSFMVLRDLRNAIAHERLLELAAGDLSVRLRAILGILDLLAGWAENPLIEAPRRHPRLRGMLQFNVIAGAPPWRHREVLDELDDLPERDGYFIRWSGPKGPFLVDLHPFVYRTRNGPRHEPFLFLSATYDTDGSISRASYRSLVTGHETTFTEGSHRALLTDLTKSLVSG